MEFKRGGSTKERLGIGVQGRWQTILDIMNLPDDKREDVALCADRIHENFKPREYDCLAPGVGNPPLPDNRNDFEKSMVSTSLLILSRINDLSQVEFIDRPFTMEGENPVSLPENKLVMTIKIGDLSHWTGAAEEAITNEFINEVSSRINKKISEGCKILMYLPVQDIKYETTGDKAIIKYRTRYSNIKK